MRLQHDSICGGFSRFAANREFGDAQGLIRYHGGVNRDLRADISEFGYFLPAHRTHANINAALDMNNDGRIDIADFGQLGVRFSSTLSKSRGVRCRQRLLCR